MQIETTRQGVLVKNLHGDLAYRSFKPVPLPSVFPLNLSDRARFTLAACSRRLGEIAGMARFVPNADMYLTMYVRKEALLSAQIEGTQCTFDDIFDPGNDVSVHRDVAEVVSYVNALNYAVHRMEELPLCTRLLRETHGVLLRGTRGEDKSPGDIRTSQNWIGPSGCTLREAPYVPPNVDDMRTALSDLDAFINDGEDIDPIVKAALVHYQFETIHPFLDGNGRLGRLLITLSLINDGALQKAVFYPSYQLKKRRAEYYRHLTDVRERGRYEEWVEFFAESLLASAEDAVKSMDELVAVHSDAEAIVRERMGRSASNGLRLLELAEAHPILDIPFATERLGLARGTVATLVKAFCEAGIFTTRDEGKQRYRTYLFERYLNVLRADTAPL